MSDETWTLINEKKALKVKLESAVIETSKVLFRNLHRQKAREVKSSVRRDRRHYAHCKAEEAEEAANRNYQRKLFKITKELGGNSGRNYNGVIKDVNGNKLTKDEDKKARWQEHFKDVLNSDDPLITEDFQDEPLHPLEIDIAPVTTNELNHAIFKLKNNKSPGEDRISAEMCKALGELGVNSLLELVNNVWQEEQVPADWRRGVIVRIPKKGDLSNCSNWRGITLLSVIGKILSNVIYDRIKETVFDVLSENQAGFREGRGCADYIFVLRHIVEQCEEWRKSLVLNFVDFSKAFDSIHRPSLWKLLKLYGLPNKIVALIKSMFEGSESCVRVGQEHTDWFEITTGVRQGDVLSPLLFNIVIDYTMGKLQQVEGGLRWTAPNILKGLAYADDICLLGEDVDSIIALTDTLNAEAKKLGLNINTQKTKTMKLMTADGRGVTVDGQELENVDSFVYLGSTLCEDGDVRKEVRARIGKASAAFNGLKNVWSSTGITRKTKLQLFNAIVMAVLLYCCESWKGLRDIELRVRRFESNCLRKIMNIRWFEHISEEQVRERSGQRSVIEKIRYHRWRWYGHVLRMPEDRLPKQALGWTPEGSRRVGRPKDTWRRTIAKDKRERNIDVNVEELAQRRDDWRNFITALWAT